MQPFNLEQFAAQARAMQDHVAQMQSRLESASVTEDAGDGLVRISLGAHGRVQAVSIDPTCWTRRSATWWRACWPRRSPRPPSR